MHVNVVFCLFFCLLLFYIIVILNGLFLDQSIRLSSNTINDIDGNVDASCNLHFCLF